MFVPVTYPSLFGCDTALFKFGELKTWVFETAIGWNDKVGSKVFGEIHFE
jgi:hypothetical protein